MNANQPPDASPPDASPYDASPYDANPGPPGPGRRAAAGPAQAFSPAFLARLRERDEPPTAARAASAGPWAVEECAEGWAVRRLGEPLAAAAAVCGERQDALLLAAALPGSATAALRLDPRRGAGGYHLVADGRAVGRLVCFDTRLVTALEALRALVASPRELALLLEAAGHEALDLAGRALAAHVGEEAAGDGG